MKKSKRLVLCALFGVSGLSLLTGCETAEIQAVVSGVDLVAGQLVDLGSSKNDTVTLGDWLLGQLTN